MATDNHLDSNLPEAVESNNLPITVPRDGEGIQAVPQRWHQGDYYRTIEHDGNESAPQVFTAEKAGEHDKSKMSSNIWRMLGVILAILIALAVGLGAGVGVGLKSGSNKRTNPDAHSQITNATSVGLTTSRPSTSSSSPTSSTCSGVTSGQTGIACVSCNQSNSDNGGYIADTGSSTTISFNELCNIDMPGGSAVYNTTTNEASTSQNLIDIGALTSYSFTDCMNQCARYNQQYGADSEKYPCRAVTYDANLTAAFEIRGDQGNCYFKNARGIGVYSPDGNVMSAYINT